MRDFLKKILRIRKVLVKPPIKNVTQIAKNKRRPYKKPPAYMARVLDDGVYYE